ncbi:uncharacterized protein TNCV_3650201 [Trichonephila clavipes]|nr:uncharacterized protein TNCV_3650201 [Trichonephila clavipes]
MARTKQTGYMESGDRILEMATSTAKAIKEKILSMEFVPSDQQMCDYLTMKWQLARASQCGIELLEGKLDINRTIPNFMSAEDIQAITTELEAMKKELPTVLGEIALIFCPVKDCPTHTNRTQSDSAMTKSNGKSKDINLKPKQNNINPKEKIPKESNSNSTNDKNKIKTNKRAGQEDFKTPNKFAKKIIEIPIEHVVYTSNNKFAVLEEEEIMEITPAPTPKPATAEDQEKIKQLLIIKKADHYVIEHPKIIKAVIKAVIKGLPASTNITDIESDLKEKGFNVEKIVQLQVVPFRRRPGASQCFNCNYFNHSSKECRMTPRCLKCGENHITKNCPITDRLKTLHCINCNEDGHMATSRQCPNFPKIKPKKGETPASKNTINQSRIVTPEFSYANVCSNKTKQKMAPRGETPVKTNKSSNEKTQDNAEPTFKFENFATYITELQNLTSKFPEIFRALEDMAKTNNDVEKLNIFLVAIARSCNSINQITPIEKS